MHTAHRVHRLERLHTVVDQVDHTVLPEWSCSDPLLLPPAANCGSESPSQRCSRRPSPPFQDVALRSLVPTYPLLPSHFDQHDFPKTAQPQNFHPSTSHPKSQRLRITSISLSIVICNVGHSSIGVTKTPTGADLCNIAQQSLDAKIILVILPNLA